MNSSYTDFIQMYILNNFNSWLELPYFYIYSLIEPDLFPIHFVTALIGMKDHFASA